MDEPSVVVEPGREWRRALVACWIGTGLVGIGFLLFADVDRSAGVVVGTAAAVLVLGFLATLVAAGAPPTLARRVVVHPDRILLETDEGERTIRPEEILDLRPARLLLADGDSIDMPPAVRAAVRPLAFRALLDAIRSGERVYRHEVEAPRPAVRVALWVVGIAVSCLVGLGIVLAARTGALPLAVVGSFGIGLLIRRAIGGRREDLVRSEALDAVTLDGDGVRIAERRGGITTIPWSEIEAVPPVSGRRAILVETAETTHVLPWSFHPSLGRDLHLIWRSQEESEV